MVNFLWIHSHPNDLKTAWIKHTKFRLVVILCTIGGDWKGKGGEDKIEEQAFMYKICYSI